MIISVLTWAHVAISLAGILCGFVVLFGLLTRTASDRWTAIFLWSTVTTSVTGFLFPVAKFLPSHAVGILSLVVLAAAIYARYRRRLQGGWHKVYVISAVTALYLNVFVGVVQTFLKTPALKALAPTQREPPFTFTQLAILVLFMVLGTVATLRTRIPATQTV